MLVGVAAAAILRRADAQASVLAGGFLLFVVLELGFLVLTTALPASRAIGLPSWLLVSIANLVAAAAMGAYLWRAHPLVAGQLDRALGGGEPE